MTPALVYLIIYTIIFLIPLALTGFYYANKERKASRLNMDKIAQGLGAERRGKVVPTMAQMVAPVSYNISATDTRAYYENKMRRLIEEDPVKNREQINDISDLLKISE